MLLQHLYVLIPRSQDQQQAAKADFALFLFPPFLAIRKGRDKLRSGRYQNEQTDQGSPVVCHTSCTRPYHSRECVPHHHATTTPPVTITIPDWQSPTQYTGDLAIVAMDDLVDAMTARSFKTRYAVVVRAQQLVKEKGGEHGSLGDQPRY